MYYVFMTAIRHAACKNENPIFHRIVRKFFTLAFVEVEHGERQKEEEIIIIINNTEAL